MLPQNGSPVEDPVRMREIRMAKARAILGHTAFRGASNEKKAQILRQLIAGGLEMQDLVTIARNIPGLDFANLIPTPVSTPLSTPLPISIPSLPQRAPSPTATIPVSSTIPIFPISTTLPAPTVKKPLTDAQFARFRRRQLELVGLMRNIADDPTKADDLTTYISEFRKIHDLMPEISPQISPQNSPQKTSYQNSPQKSSYQNSPQKSLPIPKKQLTPKQQSPLPISPSFDPFREITDDYAGSIELQILLKEISDTLDRELRFFGKTGTFTQMLRELGEKVAKVFKVFAAAATGKAPSPQIPLDMYVASLNEWKTDLQEIIDGQLALGRRCNNEEDFITFDTIEELDEANFIHLESGDCWEIGSLIDYIREKNGLNSTAGLKTPGSKKIWADGEELQRILRHPEAIKLGFDKWYIEQLPQIAARISVKTLQNMANTASVLLERGPEFEKRILKELNPEQLRFFRQYGNRLREPILNPRTPYEILANEVYITIDRVMKSAVLIEFVNYWNSLSEDERDAIEMFGPTFKEILFKCHGGHWCNFGTGDTMLMTRNEIADVKKLPLVDYGSRFQD